MTAFPTYDAKRIAALDEQQAAILGVMNRRGYARHEPSILQPAQIFLAVHRLDFSVYFRRIEREDFSLLSALRSGKTVERAIELSFRRSTVPTADRAAFVRRSFQTWATLGWFCHPEKQFARVKDPREES